MRMRMSIYACRNAKTMRRCTPSCVSWQHQRELDPRGGPSQVQPHHMRSHTSAVHAHLRSHGDTHLHVTRSPSIHAHHAAKEHTHAHANKYACDFITRCTSVLLSYYFGIYGIIICDCGHAHARMKSVYADALRIVECSMLLATIAPAPCRSRACCPLRISIVDV